MPAKKTKTIPLVLRLPPDIHRVARRIAKEEDRSLNSWIIRTLRSAILAPRIRKTPSPPANQGPIPLSDEGMAMKKQEVT